MQLAGVSNVALKNVNSVQIAGVVNFGRDIGGLQLAGVLNASYGYIDGSQIAGVLNTSRSVKSLQLAGVANVTADTVYGAQVASVFNFGRKVRGFQLALFNFGDSTSGTSIGLINLFWRGYNSLEVTTNEVLPMHVQLRMGGYHFYNIFGIGTQGFSTGNVWGYTYGMGTAIRLGRKRNLLHLDLTTTDLQDDDSWFENVTPLVRFELNFAWGISRRFALFGGPSLNNFLFTDEDQIEYSFIQELAPYTMYEGKWKDWTIQGWVGFNAGLRIHLYF